MVKIKCNQCFARGVKFYTHGKNSKAIKSLTHNKGCSKISRRRR